MSRGGKAWRSSSCSIGMCSGSSAMATRRLGAASGAQARAVSRVRSGGVFGLDDGLDSAADGEVADHGHAAGIERGDQVVEDLIGDLLVEDALVAELPQ